MWTRCIMRTKNENILKNRRRTAEVRGDDQGSQNITLVQLKL